MLLVAWLRARRSLRPIVCQRHAGRRASCLSAAERLEERMLLTAYVVDTLSDAVAVDGQVSLREAIQAANTSAGVTDAITFNVTLTGGTIALGGARLDITDDVTITGLGAEQLSISGLAASQIFAIAAGTNVEISGLTLKSGAALGSTVGRDGGGAIYNAGTLTLVDSVLSGNRAAFSGGAILNAGTLDVIGSTLFANQATDGGAIFNLNGATLKLANSTVSGNSTTENGGGLFNALGGAMTLTNATIVGNRADRDGDGRGIGGGLYAYQFDGGSNLVLLRNTIFASNVLGVGSGTASDLFVTRDGFAYNGVVSAASRNNLVTSVGTAGGLVNGVNGNIVGVNPRRVLDPVLQDNGGQTPTHALLPASPAVDAGDTALALDPDGNPLVFDQRGTGFPRLFGAAVDIGAFESQVPIPDPDSIPRDDLSGFYAGGWWIGKSDGIEFDTTAWAGWDPTGWQRLGHGDFDGDGLQDVFGFRGGNWWIGLSTGSSFTTSLWASWANVSWELPLIGDLNGDGKDDILARTAYANWWGALSTGSGFATPTLWTQASPGNVDVRLLDFSGDGKADFFERFGFGNGERLFVGVSDGTEFSDSTSDALFRIGVGSADGVAYGDFNGDGKMDVFRREGGSALVVTLSTGTNFSTNGGFVAENWGTFSGAWVDVRSGDFDANGFDDIAARQNGYWHVFLSDGTTFHHAVWDFWVEGGWQDVIVGDFDGDGTDDIAGRRGGNWWVSISTGSAFTHDLWDTWSNVVWQAVAAGDATGDTSGAFSAAAFAPDPGTGSSLLGPLSPEAVLPAVSVTDDEPLGIFWSGSDEDEEFAAELFATV